MSRICIILSARSSCGEFTSGTPITDPHTGKPYPPAAQHAIKQGEVAAPTHIYYITGSELLSYE
jgi:NADH dehydrogenase FAD-containing subunit